MSTRKERERAEAAEAKAAEKIAKKAELAAKRAARDAEKAAKKAEEDEAAGDEPEETQAEEETEEEEEDPNAWQEEEELALLEGLRLYPKGQGDFANEGERWQMICAVEGLERRDALECVAHYKELLNRVRAAKAAAAADGDGKKEVSMDSVIKRRGPAQEEAHARDQEAAGSCRQG
jgi:hypothetical protein